jgi:hypothetical protein
MVKIESLVEISNVEFFLFKKYLKRGNFEVFALMKSQNRNIAINNIFANPSLLLNKVLRKNVPHCKKSFE